MLYRHLEHIHLEGNVSQIVFYSGLSFDFISNKREDLDDLFKQNFLHCITKKNKKSETPFPACDSHLWAF